MMIGMLEDVATEVSTRRLPFGDSLPRMQHWAGLAHDRMNFCQFTSGHRAAPARYNTKNV